MFRKKMIQLNLTQSVWLFNKMCRVILVLKAYWVPVCVCNVTCSKLTIKVSNRIILYLFYSVSL